MKELLAKAAEYLDWLTSNVPGPKPEEVKELVAKLYDLAEPPVVKDSLIAEPVAYLRKSDLQRLHGKLSVGGAFLGEINAQPRGDLVAVYADPQPDHIPDAGNMISDQLRDGTKRIGRPQIREVFLRNGAVADSDDMPDYVYESVFELLELAAPAVQGELVAWATRLYNTAYHAGHHDTVEGCYTHVYPQDMDSYHEDVVQEWLDDNPQPTEQKPAPDVSALVEAEGQARPFHDLDPNWLYSVIRYARKAGFDPDVTEGLREMDEDEAFLVPNLYAAPQPAEQQPDVTQLVEAMDITELLKLLLILRGNIGGAMWTLDDEEEELAVRTEKAIDAIAALAAHRKQGGEA